MSENVGMYWNSIWTASGKPLPAFKAVRSLVYCGVPWPALTTFTLIAGYFFWNRSTSFWMFGTQVQNVSSVGVDIALSMSAWLTVADASVEPLSSEPLHAVSPSVAAMPSANHLMARRGNGIGVLLTSMMGVVRSIRARSDAPVRRHAASRVVCPRSAPPAAPAHGRP